MSFQEDTKKPFLISLILPVYNESKNLIPLMSRLIPVLERYQYEIIFVDDASADNSFEVISQYVTQNPEKIRALRFSRNFGHQIAITAGIEHASGDVVIVMDTDLQDPPEVIPELISSWEKGSQIVYARRKTRKDTWFKKITAFGYYRVLSLFTDLKIPFDSGDFRLMDRVVIDALNEMPERSRFVRGLTAWTGFSQSSVLFDRHERKEGKTSYSFLKMFKFALDGITSFSLLPLRLVTYLGLLAVILGGVAGVGMILFRVFSEGFLPVWMSIIVASVFVGGVQLTALGVIGEYIGRIYTEVQQRPLYFIAEKKNFE